MEPESYTDLGDGWTLVGSATSALAPSLQGTNCDVVLSWSRLTRTVDFEVYDDAAYGTTMKLTRVPLRVFSVWYTELQMWLAGQAAR